MEELDEFFNSEAQFLDNKAFREMIQECDYNNDGFISYEELMKHIRGKRREMLMSNNEE